jgi:hypothetical protein
MKADMVVDILLVLEGSIKGGKIKLAAQPMAHPSLPNKEICI